MSYNLLIEDDFIADQNPSFSAADILRLAALLKRLEPEYFADHPELIPPARIGEQNA